MACDYEETFILAGISDRAQHNTCAFWSREFDIPSMLMVGSWGDFEEATEGILKYASCNEHTYFSLEHLMCLADPLDSRTSRLSASTDQVSTVGVIHSEEPLECRGSRYPLLRVHGRVLDNDRGVKIYSSVKMQLSRVDQQTSYQNAVNHFFNLAFIYRQATLP